MIITVWDAVNRPEGRTADVPWRDLPTLLATLPTGSLWAPAEYREGYHDSEHYERSHALILDHDAATVPIEMLPELLAGSRAYVHKTKTPGRWRAVIELAHPVNATEYERATKPIANALECARESWSPYHMWFPPNGSGVIPIDGEPYTPALKYSARVRAWIAGDWNNAVIRDDLSRKADGTPDRSAVDMVLTHALAGAGASDSEIAEILTSRGELSHRTDERYVSMTIRKARARQAKDSEDFVTPAKRVQRVDGGRPCINVGPDIDRVADECASVLASRPDIYARGEALVSVAGREAHVLTPSLIADELSRGAVFLKPTKDGDRAIEPPERVCRILCDRKVHAARQLKVIAPFPLVRSDGTVASEPGYDSATESLFVGERIDIASVPPHAALALLREPFSEFPYERDGMIDVVVSLILTIVCRQAIAGNVPLFVLDASQMGAGKSLLATSVSLLALGEHVPFESWPDDTAELDKKLSATALSAVPYASFDEAQVVGGGPLNSLLTGNGKHAFRRLGKSERVQAEWRTVLSVAANNIAIKGDTRRRTIECRLTPGSGPRKVSRDLHMWIPENRNRLLGAALSLVCAHIRAKGSGPPWPSFERWSHVIAGAIVSAGGHDVTQFRTPVEESDDAIARETLTLWLALRWPDGATARAIAEDMGGEMGMVSEKVKELFSASPGLETAVKDALRTVLQAHKGRALAQALGMSLRNWRQIRTPDNMYLDKSNSNPPVWRVEVES